MYTGCLSLKVGFKRSALDMGKVSVFIDQELGVSKAIGRQIGRVTYA